MKRISETAYCCLLSLLSLLSAGCETAERHPNPDPAEFISIPITVSSESMTPVETTRGSESMIPENENLIYDIILLQFNSSGLLINSSSQEIEYASGKQEIQDLQADHLLQMDHGAIGLIVNTKSSGKISLSDNKYLQWQRPDGSTLIVDRYSTFRQILLELPYEEDKHILSRMYMYGVYEGPIQSQKPIVVTLRRLCSKINLDIVNQTGQTVTGTIRIHNVSKQTRIMPTLEDYATEFYTFQDALKVESNRRQRFYYYVGERIDPQEEHRMSVELELDGYTCTPSTIPLGTAPFATQFPDFSLYSNCYYTPTIYLRDTPSSRTAEKPTVILLR